MEANRITLKAKKKILFDNSLLLWVWPTIAAVGKYLLLQFSNRNNIYLSIAAPLFAAARNPQQ